MRLRRSLPSGAPLAKTPTAAVAAGLLLLAAGPLMRPDGAMAMQPRPSETYAITPQRRALLNTIRFAEGTWQQGAAGYRTLYGGGRVQSLQQHPEVVVVKRYTSAAAGAYQFLPATWREAATELQLTSFEARNQDQAALYLIALRGVLQKIDDQGLTAEVMAVLAKEWASFPVLNGRSAYGQPVKKADDLTRFYRSNLQALMAQA